MLPSARQLANPTSYFTLFPKLSQTKIVTAYNITRIPSELASSGESQPHSAAGFVHPPWNLKLGLILIELCTDATPTINVFTIFM